MQVDQISFVEHFDEVVKKNPRRVAIESSQSSVTYLELQNSSFRIAGQLAESIDKPNEIIGLHLEKSASFLAAVIACWRLRCAWVPIPPQLPQIKQQFILDDCTPALVLTDDSTAQRFTLLQDAPSVVNPTATEMRDWHAGDLAYVIYTSGTTGVPCGVEVTHQGIMNLLRAQVSAFQLNPESRSVWYYPTSFDASVSDWGTALYAGSTLLIEHELNQCNPQEFVQWLSKHRISHADLPPSLLKILPDEQVGTNLRTIVIGGQATDQETIGRWCSKVRLVNVYGPTEATVCTSLNVCSANEQRPMLGEPIHNVTYHVVNSDLQPVPLGHEGELLISGPCVARGYRNQPEKTQKHFVDYEDCKSYRSGDLVRQDSDGCLVYCGRIDRQINLNGLRIEPEEIESQLSSLPSVTGAAVLMRKLTPLSTTPRLIAFVEARDRVSPDAIRSHLLASLPPERIPQRFEVRSSLPRTSSGKIDLAALASCELSKQDFEGLADGSLKKILELFREATGESHFGADDRWQDWGADSLSAMHIVSLASQCGIKLPLWLFGSNPSPREVVRFLDNGNVEAPLLFPYACPTSKLHEDAKSLLDGVLQTHPNRLGNPSCHSRDDILLTGATGFLGCRVLEELSRKCDARIICLVRPGDQEIPNRLRRHLSTQEVDCSSAFNERVVVEAGEIASPKMGLSDSKYQDLLSTVRTVVHCAGNINALSAYEELRSTNVIGTGRVLEFCRMASAHLHHASTLSVYVGTDVHAGVFRESSEVSAKLAYGGYAQSKLAAEYLLTEASYQPLTIYRLGLLAADRRSGIYARNDILTSVVRGLLIVGCIPVTNESLRFDVTPVDYAAAAVAMAVDAQREQDPRAILHVAGRSTMTLQQLVDYLRSHVPIEEVSTETFWERVSESEANGGLSRLEATTLRASFSRWLLQESDISRALDLFQSTETTFDCKVTGEYVESMGVAWPYLTEELIDSILRRLCIETIQEWS